MIEGSAIYHIVMLSLLPNDLFTAIANALNVNPNLVILVAGGLTAFLLAYLLTFVVKVFCYKVGWLDRPAARRIHLVAVPRLGGVAMFLAFLLASQLFYTPGSTTVNSQYSEGVIYWLFIAAATLMVTVHAYDDILGLKPLPKLIAQTLAVIILLAPGRTSFHGILLFSFNNPFPWYHQPYLYLFVDNNLLSLASIPAVLFTWFWIVGMMNTVNLIDGMDGLAAGVVAITGLIIAVISWMLNQHSIAILATIFSCAVLGFLPHNWNPAKIFMGDTGSMFLGLGLAVLSTVGGAKLALALMVLGVPILDVAVVMINRLRRGQSPLHYDKTHLHYRLMATGLSVRQICYLFYGLTLAFGLLALGLSSLRYLAHFYKVIGIGLVGVVMVALIIWIDYRQRKRGVHIKLGGPEAEPQSGSEAPALPGAVLNGHEAQENGAASEASKPVPQNTGVFKPIDCVTPPGQDRSSTAL